MAWRLAAAVLLLAPALAGCIGEDGLDTTDTDSPALQGDALEPVRPSPHTTPHPAYGFPIRTHAPVETPDWWAPPAERPVPAEVRELEPLAQTDGTAEKGGGIAVFGSLVAVPDFTLTGSAEEEPVAIIDISDPLEPTGLSSLPTLARDAEFIAYPDGRLILVLATGSGVMPVWDVTDPTEPSLLAEIEPPTGTHNVAVVPGTPIVYNANTQGRPGPEGMSAVFTGQPVSQGQTEIYDLSDPDEPELVEAWSNGYGCHDITFFNDLGNETFRAYCAGIEATQVWDTANPLEPEIVATYPFVHGDADLPSTGVGLVTQSHLAMVNHDASILVVGDETGSGAAPACDARAAGTSGLLGNLYIYDITDETDPQLLSWISPGTHIPSNPPPQDGPLPVAGCTAHYGDWVPHPDRELLAMAFYGAGTVLIDLTDPSEPAIVDQFNPQANTWDVWFHQGYLITGDMARGMDVLGLR